MPQIRIPLTIEPLVLAAFFGVGAIVAIFWYVPDALVFLKY